MNYADFLRKIERLKQLIESEATGSSEKLSKKLCLSRRTLFNYFELLKDEGYSVKFCKFRKTYYFEKKP